MSGAIRLLPLYAFMAWKGQNKHFFLYLFLDKLRQQWVKPGFTFGRPLHSCSSSSTLLHWRLLLVYVCPPDSGTQFIITLQSLTVIQKIPPVLPLQILHLPCSTYWCFVEADCCKRIGEVLSRKLTASLICQCWNSSQCTENLVSAEYATYFKALTAVVS